MTKRQRILVLVGVLVVVGLVAATLVVWLTNSPDAAAPLGQKSRQSTEASPGVNAPVVDWNVPATALPADEGQALRNEFLKSSSVQRQIPAGRSLSVTQASISGASAVIYAGMRHESNRSVPLGTEPLIFLGTKADNAWTIVAQNDDAFCKVLNETPDDILSPQEKDYFLGC
jgi:hypothetical protein